MEQLEEINLKENLEDSIFRAIKATPAADMQAREYLYLELKVLDRVFDMMRLQGGK